jgi:hypothetical protein
MSDGIVSKAVEKDKMAHHSSLAKPYKLNMVGEIVMESDGFKVLSPNKTPV